MRKAYDPTKGFSKLNIDEQIERMLLIGHEPSKYYSLLPTDEELKKFYRVDLPKEKVRLQKQADEAMSKLLTMQAKRKAKETRRG